MPKSTKKFRRKSFKEGDKCCYCRREMYAPNSTGAKLNPSQIVTIEHYYYPQSRGGGNDDYNIKLACYRCNNLRGDVNVYVFQKFAEVVLRKYPNAPTIILRNSLKQYISSVLDFVASNNQALIKASSLALLSLADESWDYKEK
jgi:hypothetical protein